MLCRIKIDVLDSIKIVLKRSNLLIALGLAVLFFIMGRWLMVEGVCGVYHDDAIYVSTAKSLADGQGYCLINLPGSPVQTKYPPFYPLVLAAIWKMWPSFPANLSVMQYVSLLSGAIGLGLCYLYLVSKTSLGRASAVTVCLICVTSKQYLYFSTLTMSEPLFFLLLILALWAMDARFLDNTGRLGQFGTGVLWAMPFLCRTIGVVVPLTGVLLLWKWKRPIFWPLLGALVTVMPWLLFGVFSSGKSSDSVIGNIWYSSYLDWWLRFGGWSLAKVVVLNIITGTISTVTAAFAGIKNFALEAPGYLVLFIWLIAEGGMLIGLWAQLKKDRAIGWFVLMYLGVVVIWPWPPHRFVVAVLPLLIGIVFSGWFFLRDKFFSGYQPKFFTVIVIAAILLFNIQDFQQQALANARRHYPVLEGRAEEVEWGSYQNLFSWIGENTSSDDILACGLDSMVYLYTGRKTVRLFVTNPLALFYFDKQPPVGELEEFESILESYSVDYLVRLPMPGFSEEKHINKLLEQASSGKPDVMKVVYQGDDPRFQVVRLLSDSR